MFYGVMKLIQLHLDDLNRISPIKSVPSTDFIGVIFLLKQLKHVYTLFNSYGRFKTGTSRKYCIPKAHAPRGDEFLPRVEMVSSR